MEFSFIDFLTLVGALGFFIYGMKVMSDGVQKAAGSRLRDILSSMTRNRYLGVFTGFLITCLVQSSSATTVMIVSFANAGLLTLVESIAVIMGANIGTTVTAWLISIFGFKFSISSIALPIIAIGFPMMFSKKEIFRSTAEVFIGFALLFLGLDALKDSIPDLNQNPEVLNFLSEYSGRGLITLLLFVLVGTIVTVIVQSSSAAMALTLTLLFNDVITYEIAAAMVLGENIGTTITANVAAMVANVHAKRAARAHFIFNLIGVIWMILFFSHFLNFVDYLWKPLAAIIPSIDETQEELKLSLFHTVFNIVNTALMVGFIPYIAKIVVLMVPSKGMEDEAYTLEYIGTGTVVSTEASILESHKELLKFARLVRRMTGFISDLLLETDKKKFQQILDRIKKYEEITDRIEAEIIVYLAKVSENELGEKNSIRIRAMLSIASDLESIGDINYGMSKTIQRKAENKIYFIPKQREKLLAMYELVVEAMDKMLENLQKPTNQIDIESVYDYEKRINAMRDKLRKEYFKSMEKGEYQYASGMVYSDLFTALERVGDYVIRISDVRFKKPGQHHQ